MNLYTRNIYTGLDVDIFLQQPDKINNDSVIAIILSPNEKVLNTLYETVCKLTINRGFQFFLVIKNNCISFNKNSDAIGRFFLLSNYYFRRENYPVLVYEEDLDPAVKDGLITWSNSQGFKGPEIAVATAFNTAHQEDDRFLLVKEPGRELFFDTFLTKLKALIWINQAFILHTNDVTETISIADKVNTMMDSLKIKDPALYALLSRISCMEQDMKQKEHTIEYLQMGLNNLTTFNALLQESDEIGKILEFYHTQYEVLPLWYKRFGHIIKILMGKRKISFTNHSKRK